MKSCWKPNAKPRRSPFATCSLLAGLVLLCLSWGGCKLAVSPAQTEDFDAYVASADHYLRAHYPDDFQPWRGDSLPLPHFEAGDSSTISVEGATYLGGFGMNGRPIHSELFAVDVIGDTAMERMLLISKSNHSTFANFDLLFFKPLTDSQPPFAAYSMSAEDLTEIRFVPMSTTARPDILLYYAHGPSIYLNAGMAILQFAGDTVREIANIQTMYYDWKDYGKSYVADGQSKLAEDEAYRQLSHLEFTNLEGDDHLEIVEHVRAEVVLQNWDLPVNELISKSLVDSHAMRWTYSPTTARYESAPWQLPPITNSQPKK